MIAALRLPFTLVTGFLLVLFADARALMLTDELFPDVLTIDSFGDALLASLVMAAVSIVHPGADRDQRRRRVHAARGEADRPPPGRRDADATPRGSSSSRSTGSALPVLRNAMRDGSAPNLARWIAEDGYRLAEWETDLSSQTGASQAGILLGSNDDIPAFRWVEKETAR